MNELNIRDESLQNRGLRFTTAELTNTGGRQNNEDSCGHLLQEGRGCWVVADGLGGHSGGEVASETAVREILGLFSADPTVSPESILEKVRAANDAIARVREEDPRLSSMGTTVVVLAIDVETALCAHVGDSRLYHLRRGQIIFQTKDHSVVQAMADAGEIPPEGIRFHEDRNRLLRRLGAREDFRAATAQLDRLLPGDAFLLCSDGHWEYVTELEMQVDYSKAETPAGWLHAMEERILEKAEPGHDNYSAVAVFVES